MKVGEGILSSARHIQLVGNNVKSVCIVRVKGYAGPNANLREPAVVKSPVFLLVVGV